MSDRIRILLLEDSSLDAELIRAQVHKVNVSADIDVVMTRDEFERALVSAKPDLILSDYSLPDFDGMSALSIAQQTSPQTPFVFVSGTLGEDIAIDALHHGAKDYVLKQRLDRLGPAVQRALDEAKLRKLQQASEHALQASELRFRELADAIPQLVWATDARGKIKYCNGRARSYAGERAESGDVPGIEICHVDDRPNLKRIWQRSIETGSPASTEYRLRQAKDGAYRWHLAQFVPLHDGSSKVEGWVVTAVEVEEQKRREQALLESERALLRATETLEQRVEERTAAYSRLSARLLTIQDDERRKIARDLHDGFGQTLVALKTNLDTLHDLADGLPEERRLQMQAECGQLLEDCLSEVRTISYLLHPPLLDESGLALAARWYVNGFSERSGIETRLDLPSDMERLPAEVETVLFRVLQAALSNVHRHAGARQVDVKLTVDTTRVQMRIRDYGVGIPEDKLRVFRKGGFDVGVGLAGMRERVRDLNGSLEVTSNGGTTVAVTIPVQGCRAGETTTRQPLLA